MFAFKLARKIAPHPRKRRQIKVKQKNTLKELPTRELHNQQFIFMLPPDSFHQDIDCPSILLVDLSIHAPLPTTSQFFFEALLLS